MCGRFGLTRPEKLDAARFGLAAFPPVVPRYNAAPGTPILAVRRVAPRSRSSGNEAGMLTWGVWRVWSEGGTKLVNIRADTAFERQGFREMATARRCLIPADLFYEWAPGTGKVKQPFAIGLSSDEPFALGGLWEEPPKEAAGMESPSCAILTTTANLRLAAIHDRMPVIIRPDDYDQWLDQDVPLRQVRELTAPYPADEMRAWRVSLAVNKVANDYPALVEPWSAPEVGSPPPSIQGELGL